MRKLLITLPLMLLLTLTGCGEGVSSGTAAKPGEIVRYGAISSKVRGMDPMDIGDVTSSGIASNFYDTLYQYHYLKRPYEIIPSLAAGMPEVSEDGLIYTITLRDDILFQDDACFPGGKGRKVTMHDVVYSWKRLADIHNVSKNWWIFDGRIAGFNDFREYSKSVDKGKVDYDTPVEGLEVVDGLTLKITLTQKWPQILYYLAHLPTAVVPHEAVDKYGDEFLNHPVGTGPFMLKEWRRGSLIVMVRNPNFRDEFYPSEGESAHDDYPGDEAEGLLADAGKKLPFIDRAIFHVIEEDQPYWLKFMAKELDVAGIPKDNFNQAIGQDRELTPEMKKQGIILNVYDDPTTFWYGFNMEDPVVGKNLPLRQAMNLALDRNRFLELFLNNRGRPARGVLPPMFAEYNDQLNSPYTTFDVAKAKALVKEAEQVHGGKLPKITLTMGGTDTTARQMGTFLERAFEAIGLDFDVDYMDWPTAQEKVSTKSAQFYAMGWVADIPDAENFLQLFYGPNGSPGTNGMNYTNPALDDLYKQIVLMDDSPERVKLAQQMEQMVVDDLPCVFTTHRIAFVLRYDWVLNSKEHVFGYGLMKYSNIDAEKRRAAGGGGR